MSTLMDNGKSCQHCGKVISPTAKGQLCPECLMKMALGTGPGSPTGEAQPKQPPVPEELAVHFPQLEILELLGKGGMGIVYKARQPKLNRFVALKLLLRDTEITQKFADRFQREAQALAQLNHPNIVTVHDFGEAGGFYYLLMEYVDGVNLRELLRSRKITPAEALAIVPPICDALQFAHQKGIVHRDIKPENILVDKQGRVKIADFGIAKILGADQQTEPLTGERQSIGTPHYMAPEQVERPTTVDHRADIYSLGVVFYEMLTGELPIGRFASPSQKVQLDVRLDEIVLRALEKEPGRRYQQAGDVKTEIETLETPASKPHTSGHRSDKLGLGIGISAVVVLAMALVFGGFFKGETIITPASPPAVLLVDDTNATFEGEWTISKAATDKYGDSYAHASAASALPQASATFRPFVTQAGDYDVEIFFPQGTDHSQHSWWIISAAEGESRVLIDQTTNGGKWVKIAGPVNFAAGTNGYVRVVNKTSGFPDGSAKDVIVADAVRLVPPDATKKSVVVEDLTADYIIAAVHEKYKSLYSFSAEVTSTSELIYDNDPQVHLVTGSCSICVARPYYVRFTLNEANTNTIKEVVWSNDDGAFETGYSSIQKLKNHQETQVENVQYTLNWKNPKPLASELFFDTPYNWLARLGPVTLEPEQTLDRDECFVISTGTNHQAAVWIRKRDLMVTQWSENRTRIVIPDPAVAAAPVAMLEGMRQIPQRTLRLNPVPPVSPPVVVVSTAAITTTGQTNVPATTPVQPVATRAFSMRTTHKFIHIAINEPLTKNDFAHEAMPLLSDRNDPNARRRLAQALVLSGKKEQGLEEFLWCWDHGNEFKGFEGTRWIYVLPEIGNFGMKYPPALDALRKRRNQIEEKLLSSKVTDQQLNDLARLNGQLKDPARTLALFDRLPKDSPSRKVLLAHVQEMLIQANRYDDILPILDPQRTLETEMQARQREMEMWKRFPSPPLPLPIVRVQTTNQMPPKAPASPSEYMRQRSIGSWSRLLEVMAGAKRTPEAKEMADKILQFDSGEDMREALEKAAIHANNQEVVDYLHSKKTVGAP